MTLNNASGKDRDEELGLQTEVLTGLRVPNDDKAGIVKDILRC